MTRREAVLTLGAAAGLALPLRLTAQQQSRRSDIDPDFFKEWLEAQKLRPLALSSSARIAPVGEPGTPLTISGTIFAKAGTKPHAGAIIFGYQTDGTGLYGPQDAKTWRLKGWARADGRGRFRFDTVRPAPYPNRNVAAHIHFYADGGGVERQTLTTVLFEGDPLITAKERAASAALGKFGFIVPVQRTGDKEECEILFRVTDDYIF